jgi:AraC-like DNA-binding protein
VTSYGNASVLALRPALWALREKGINPRGLLLSAGISDGAIDSLDNRLPYSCVRRFWDEAAAVSGDELFGVNVASALPKGGYDVLEYLNSTAQTAAEGFRRVAEYSRIVYDRSELSLTVEPADARMTWRRPLPAVQFDEFTLTLTLVRSRQATGVGWNPQRILFQHGRPTGLEQLRAVLGTSIECGQPVMELQFDREVLELPHQGGDSRLLSILLRYADSLLTKLPGRGNLVGMVSACIAREMARGLPTLSTTAAALHRSPRTLQRQLAQAGSGYTKLVDDVRRDLAMKYIGDAGLSLGEIAFLLHFSDPGSFHRAFRRWTGETPARYRSKLFRPKPPGRRASS